MEQPDLDGNATEPSIREVVATAISWENPLLSGILTLAGIILAILGDYLIKGKHGIPLLSGNYMLIKSEELQPSTVHSF